MRQLGTRLTHLRTMHRPTSSRLAIADKGDPSVHKRMILARLASYTGMIVEHYQISNVACSTGAGEMM
jgi:hypothetical protein